LSGTLIETSAPKRLARATGRTLTLDGGLYVCTLALFVTTRFIGIERFPIYFFTDEAVQTVSAADFVHHGLRNSLGELLPTYFQNGFSLSISTSVYAQVLPYLVFGESVIVTRAVSVLVALSGTAAVGLLLRERFSLRIWWAGPLLLSITPAWFLHSRTAFEVVFAVSFYAWFLYFALRARTAGTRNLYGALLFAALAFYSYNATQLVVVVTAFALALSELRFLVRHPRETALAALLAGVLALPYLRFVLAHGGEVEAHLRLLGSYWTSDLSPHEKIRTFFSEYRLGLSPDYWYGRENGRDLDRHLLRGYGNILWPTLPIALVGLAVCVRRLSSPPHRALIIATVAAPLGGALAETLVTRSLVFVVPAAMLSAVGLDTLVRLAARRVRYEALAVGVFLVLAAVSVGMLADALARGPRWYREYGLYGMQYGARQVSAAVRPYIDAPGRSMVYVSPVWANGTDVTMRFFFPDEPRVRTIALADFLFERGPLSANDVLVLTPEEYAQALATAKLTGIRVERTIQYPDGRPGFYVVRLRYSPKADRIFAEERDARRRPVVERVKLGADVVWSQHSRFDIGDLRSIFDGDSFTVARTLDANPLALRLRFPRPRVLTGIDVTTTTRAVVRVEVRPAGAGQPRRFAAGLASTEKDPTISIAFGRPMQVDELRLEVHDPATQDNHVHVREIRLR
jgi:hypothetical protein